MRLLVPLLPPPFFFFLLSISGSGVHVIGWFWFLMYYILREVTIFGAFHVFTPNRGEKESKYSEYFVLNPHAV